MINWRVRCLNRQFWVSLVPAILVLIQVVLAVFGIEIDFGVLSGKLLAVVDAIFIVLAILGIVADPTTEGLGDSSLAMTYEIPKTKDGVTTKNEEE